MKKKMVVVGVSGSISAYKSAQLVSDLVKRDVDVHTVMTKNATQFISPLTFEALTKNKCLVGVFDEDPLFPVPHVNIPQSADALIVAPASADLIAKAANGIADDMLTSMLVAATCPVIIAPAMNKHMYLNKTVQQNIEKLKNNGCIIVEPAVGRLACDCVGVGKLADTDTLIDSVMLAAEHNKDLRGLKIVVSAGPTVEAIDPVRYITNRSSGKMGYAIARAAVRSGADTVLVSGPTALKTPFGVRKTSVTSAQEMCEAVTSEFNDCDILIMAAAVADYTPKTVCNEKIKKQDKDNIIELKRTDDILRLCCGRKQPGQVVCGFSMETENLLENSRKKLISKKCDAVAANSLRDEGAGFGTDTNKITVITENSEIALDIMSKDDAAYKLLQILKDIYIKKNKS